MILLNSVLVAFDFSDTSITALTYGQNLASAFGGRLHVLHVAPNRSANSRPYRRAASDASPKSVATRMLLSVIMTSSSG